MIAVRLAGPSDAEAMSRVIAASITQLCAADHRDDLALLSRWLANKTPDGVAAWFDNAANTLLVAERDGEIAAAGAFNTSREIILNYVAPAHRFVGVSSALLEAIEALLGAGEARLSSTATAHRFYLARGWTDLGETDDIGGITAFPMVKMLR